ncbi:MAG: nucleotidyltransferase domain-containing protein [Gaiellaceae bacterium]
MIEEVTGRYLDAVDDARPGFVVGLYVVGSAALGEWRPGRSDIDIVIFTSRVPARADLVALRDVHTAMADKPYLDGVYLSPEHGWPVDERVVPFVVDGQFHTDRPCGALNPVLWLTLRRNGVPVRGPAVSELGVPVDLDALRAYNLGNLRTYWRP